MSIYDEVYRSPNFGYPKGSSGRRNQKIIGACLHITGAAWQSNYSWIMNPSANASYNAIVKDDGKVACLVPEQNAAYSHGKIERATWALLKPGVNPNLYSLSLARTGSNQNTWTPQQLSSTIKVLKFWSLKYGFPLQRPHIFGHFEVDGVGRWYCPGRGFFDRVIEELKKTDPPELKPDLEAAAGAAPELITWHRVVAGSYRDGLQAETLAKRLRSIGMDAFVVRYTAP